MDTRRLAAADLRGLGGRARIRRWNRPSNNSFAPTRGVFSLGSSFAYEVFCFTVVFGGRADHGPDRGRSPGAYGLPLSGAFGKLFWQGCLIGLVEISVLVGLIAAFGGYSFGDVALHGKELLRWGILWAVFFVFVGLFEEFNVSGIHAIHACGEHRLLACSDRAFVLVWGRPFGESR